MATINFIKKSGNPSDYWKAAKQITEPTSVRKMELVEDGVLIQDDLKISNIMCKFFKTKPEHIEQNIPVVDEDPIKRLKERALKNYFTQMVVKAGQEQMAQLNTNSR